MLILLSNSIKLFACHLAALKTKLANESVSNIADKNNCHEQSILKVIAGINRESFLICPYAEFNHQTVSQVGTCAVSNSS